MMKKAVPLAVVLLSSGALGISNYLEGSVWTPTTPTASDTNCCYFSGQTSIALGATPAVTGVQAAGTGAGTACAAYSSQISNNVWTIPTITPSTATVAATSGTAPAAAGTDATFTVSDAGATLTFVPSVKSGGTQNCQQVLKRVAPASTFVGDWTVGDAGSTTACCYLVPGTLKITAAGAVTGVKTADTTSCTNSVVGKGADYSVNIYRRSDTVAATPLSLNADLFTYDATKGTITYASGQDNTCTQTLTKVSSSAAHYATSMVAGVAALGLVVV